MKQRILLILQSCTKRRQQLTELVSCGVKEKGFPAAMVSFRTWEMEVTRLSCMGAPFFLARRWTGALLAKLVSQFRSRSRSGSWRSDGDCQRGRAEKGVCHRRVENARHDARRVEPAPGSKIGEPAPPPALADHGVESFGVS